MRVIRRYEHATEARAAARALLESGIVAGVVQTRLSKGEVFPGMTLASTGQFQVVLRDGADFGRAQTVLDAFSLDEPAYGDAALAQGEPDLSRLDPVHLPECPRCTEPVQVLTEEGERSRACESCGEPLDVVDLIVRQHGPEAMEPCYPGASGGLADAPGEDPIDPAALRALRLRCVVCGYVLDGLPTRGHCPECGDGFDKRELVRMLLDGG